MKAKHLMLVAAFVIVLSMVSVISDDSDAGYEEYVVYGPHNNYDDNFTRFSLKAGTFSISSMSDLYEVYLVIGKEMIYLNAGYIPYDTDDAYFYSIFEGVSTIEAEITNTPVDYDVKGKMYAGAYYDSWGHDTLNPTLIKLDAGMYTFKFSRGGSLSAISGDATELFFEAGVEKTIVLNDAGEFYFRLSNSTTRNYVNDPVPIYYTMSNGSLFDPAPEGMDREEVVSSTVLKWYKQTITLGSGSHNINGSGYIYAFDSLDKATWFEENIVRKGMTFSPYYGSQSYGALGNSFELATTTTIYVYTLIQSTERMIGTMTVDSEAYLIGDMIVGGDSKSMYLLANTSSRIMVEYDHSKYVLYLYDSTNKTLLPSGVMLELNNVVSKEYWIVVEPIFCNSLECYTAEYVLYTEGIPESDGNAPLFAGLCIGLCVVSFGLLLYSGKRPKWDD